MSLAPDEKAKLTKIYNKYIQKFSDLVTPHNEIRAGFLQIALEKNKVGDPYVKEALAFKSIVSDTTDPSEFLEMPQIRKFLLTASGLSDKSMSHLNEDDKTKAIEELVEKFLKPAGNNYIDEAVFRFLLIKGDSLGGTMRNKIGALGQEKLVRYILSCLKMRGIEYEWTEDGPKSGGKWHQAQENDDGIESRIKAIYWPIEIDGKPEERILGFNLKIPIVNKNVDICLFSSSKDKYNNGNIVSSTDEIMMLGELKGGIDPAGADEHWKTGNSALERIRTAFLNIERNINTSFVAAAIESAMAEEIFDQLESGKLSNAANLTNNKQLVDYCEWIIDFKT